MACISKRRGRYVIDFYDTYGKRRWITMPKGTTKKKAKEKFREVEDQLRRGIYLPDKKIPIFKQVAKDWIEHKKPNLRQSTWSVYEGHTRNHFDDFDPIKINRVTTAKIEKWISARHNEGMNLATIKKIIVTLGQIMAYAVRHGYIDYNSAMDAERPRGNGESEESKIRVLTPAEINSFLEAERDMKYPTLFTLAIFSGARQGELLGLKWSDIDWESNQIHI
jgi:integrase